MINFAKMDMMGQLTEDPRMGETNDGSPYCKFSLAVNRRFGGGEKTAFVPVTVFEKAGAENCGKYLSKGRTVYVTGHFETDKYTDRDGVQRTGFGVIASEVSFGSGGASRSEEATEKAPTPPASVELDQLDEATRQRVLRAIGK